MGIVVLGSVFVDIKGYPIGQYIPAGRNAGRVIQVHGGVSRNIAEDIANVELRPTFVSLVDDSGIGIDVINKLKQHKVNTDYIRSVPDGLGTWLAVFDNQGDVVASISKRPDLSEIGHILDDYGDEIFKNCDSIVVEIDMERPLLNKVFAYAKRYHKDVYAAVSNMSIAIERRDLLKQTSCFVCNQQEAGIFFSEDYDNYSLEQLESVLKEKIKSAGIPNMVVTLGSQGAIWANECGDTGITPPQKVDVVDTTGAGDSFFAGVVIGLTYHKTLAEACHIGTRLASSVIATNENVCPRFMPAEFGIEFHE